MSTGALFIAMIFDIISKRASNLKVLSCFEIYFGSYHRQDSIVPEILHGTKTVISTDVAWRSQATPAAVRPSRDRTGIGFYSAFGSNVSSLALVLRG